MADMPDFTQMALNQIAEGDHEITKRMHEILDQGGNAAALHFGQGAMMALCAFITFDLKDPDRGPIGLDDWRRTLKRIGALRHVAALPLAERPEALELAAWRDAYQDLWGATAVAGDAFGIQAACGMLRAALEYLRIKGADGLVRQLVKSEQIQQEETLDLQSMVVGSEALQ